LLALGIVLTFVFIAISFFITIHQDDKAKGLGYSILVWLLLAVIYDGIILLIIYYLQDYPLENAVIALSIINPIDLARILFLIEFNISALMGYTGAVFERFFGDFLGIFISSFFLILWVIIPLFLSTRFFQKKDF
jgi:Cu-processing system permease protein